MNNIRSLRDFLRRFVLNSLINNLSRLILDSRNGLPYSLFLFISRMTPLVSVELLIQKIEFGRVYTLLTWREDKFYKGWHLPGGIIRFKEQAHARITQVLVTELGIEGIVFDGPLEVTERFNENRDVRGHFISLLYHCDFKGNLPKEREFSGEEVNNGQWAWFDSVPSNLIEQHQCYAHYFQENKWLGNS